MTLRGYVDAVRAYWRMITVVILLGLVASLAYLSMRPANYSAQAVVYVAAQSIDSPTAAYQGSLLSEQRVHSYTDLITSERVLNEVAQNLRLPLTGAELASSIEATNPANTVLINVTAESNSPEESAAVANEIVRVFSRVVEELERPASPSNFQPVVIKPVQNAVPPTEPSQVGAASVLGIGLFAGLCAALLAAIARSVLDTSVRTAAALEETASASCLGTLPLVPAQDGTRRSLLVSEPYRRLRTNLQYISVDSPPRSIAITSALSGEGKTTSAINLASALSLAGYRSLLVDADLRRPQVATSTGVSSDVGLTSILAGRVELAGAIQKAAEPAELSIVSSGPLPPNPSELLSSLRMRDFLAEAASKFDYVVIDTPPILAVTDAAAVAPNVDGMLVLCRYGRTNSSQISTACESIRAVSGRLLGVVLSMTPARSELSYDSYPAVSPSSKLEDFDHTRPNTVTASTSSRSSDSPNGTGWRPAPHRRSQ